MWPQEDHQDATTTGTTKHRMVSSSSSSSSSSPSPFASGAGAPQTPRRTMEEVWKDITLSAATPVLDSTHCVHDPYNYPHPHHPGGDRIAHRSAASAAVTTTTNTVSHFRGMILQDFLARPFRGMTAALQGAPTAVAAAAAEAGQQCDVDVSLLGSPLPLPPHPSPPATVLCLNSGVDSFQYMGRGGGGGAMAAARLGPSRSWNNNHGHNNQSHSTATTTTTTCLRHPSSSPSAVVASAFSDSLQGSPYRGFFPFCGNKKRNPEQQQQQPQPQQLDSSDGSGNDRRHKRMIKNRESAARSRARKQAYTNELELEVNHLTEENQRLRRQHEELRATIAAQLLPTRKSLQRSSTAPF